MIKTIQLVKDNINDIGLMFRKKILKGGIL
jgi:hypothetical protein